MKAVSPAWRRLLVFPPILVGVIALALAIQSRTPPERAEASAADYTVRTLVVPKLTVVPVARGYGPVQPARVWNAVAQVAAQVTEVHPELEDGEIVQAGTRLLSLDPTDFQLARAELEAERAELEMQARNAEASLTIERKDLRLAREDLQRFRRLAEQGNVSSSRVDEAERAVVAAEKAVQNLENTLALIPAQRRVLETRQARAEEDLKHTEITAPFDLRVANRSVEAFQYLTVGQSMFQGDGIERVEAIAQVPLGTLRHLILARPDWDMTVDRLLQEDLTQALGVTAEVRLDLGDRTAEWDAELVRIRDTVDPATRTVGLVVAVDNPFEQAIPGERPPLTKGMFVEVILRGAEMPEQIVVPRQAVRDGRVWIVDAQDRLRSRAVTRRFEQRGISLIAAGLSAGERVVLSDPTPMVAGMRVRAEPDGAAARALRAAARGETR